MKAPSLRSMIAAGSALALAAVGFTLSASASVASAPLGQSSAAAAAPSPHQWLTGYWHNFDNGSATLRVKDIPAAYNLVAIAFAENAPGVPGGIQFTLSSAELGGYTVPEFKADVASLKTQGRKSVLSVGGEKGNVIVDSAASATNFATSTYATMQEFGFDGVDIDLEHGINAQYMSDALHQLRALAGPGLIITMAPQTIDYQAVSMPYYQLTTKIKDILTIVNVQYYNSGAMMGCNQQVYSQGSVDFLTSLACIQLEMGLRPDQVGIGVPAVRAAAGGGYQSMSNVVAAVDCLEKRSSCGAFVPTKAYGPIGGVMTWSVNWDATNNYELASTLSKRLNVGGAWTPPTTPTQPPTTAPTTPPTTPPVTSPPTTPGTCGAAWESSKVYTGGAAVSYNGRAYTAKWWTLNEIPGTAPWGPWAMGSACA